MRNATFILAIALSTVACESATSEVYSGVGDINSARTIADGSDEATIVLYLANRLDEQTLDDDVTLDSRAAANIVAYRAGVDTIEGTSDDEFIDDLDELDAISYVGESAMADLLSYGEDRGMTGEDVHGVLVGSIEAEAVRFVANMLNEDSLDDDVGLDSRAAANIITDRASGELSLFDLDDVSYVSARAFGKLVDFADSHGMMDDEGLIVRNGDAYDSLDDALDAGGSANVDLFAGTYLVNSTISSTLIVRGYDVDRTVLDGDGAGSVLQLTSGSPCFYDLTIQNGSASYGGGVYSSASGAVLFDNVRFVDNHASIQGGGLIAMSASSFTLNDVVFDGNEASGHGGAAHLSSSVGQAYITDSAFTHNRTGGYAGALLGFGNVDIQDSVFEDNEARGGSAMYLASTAVMDMRDSAVKYNVDSLVTLGAMFINGATVDVDNVDFYSNTVGDVYHSGSQYDGLGSATSFSCASGTCTGL